MCSVEWIVTLSVGLFCYLHVTARCCVSCNCAETEHDIFSKTHCIEEYWTSLAWPHLLSWAKSPPISLNLNLKIKYSQPCCGTMLDYSAAVLLLVVDDVNLDLSTKLRLRIYESG